MEPLAYRLDTVHECVWARSGTDREVRLPLAPKAYRVLRYLLDNADALVTHDDLLRAVWNDAVVQPEVLKTHVLAIRKALGDRANRPRFIETVRGRGYRFIGPLSQFASMDDVAPGFAQSNTVFGRTEPLRILADSWAGAQARTFRALIIAGESGIGKTAVLGEFLHTIGPQQRTFIARGQCVEGFAGLLEPYYPILGSLAGLCAGPLGPQIIRTLVAIAPTWASQLTAHIPSEKRTGLSRQLFGATRERMLREGCDLFSALAAERGVVLVLEDLHWADYATLDFVSAICRRHPAAPLMVVGTLRPEELKKSGHPLEALSRELYAGKLCTRIELGPLGLEDIVKWISGGAPENSQDEEFAGLLRDHSGGNPLYLQATLEDLADRGLVSRQGRRWKPAIAAEALELRVPRTLEGLIEARLGRLTELEQRVLESASIGGRTFNAPVCAIAADLDPQTFEDVCEELTRRSLFIDRSRLVSLPGNRLARAYEFRHAVYRHALYDRVGPLRRTRMHLAIAGRIEALYAPAERAEHFGALADHYASAQEWETALDYLRLALRTAHRRFAYRDALKMLDRANEIADLLPEERRAATRLELLQRRAGLYGATHDGRALGAFMELTSRAAMQGNVDLQVQALLGAANAASWYDAKDSMNFLNRAAALVADQAASAIRDLARVSIHVMRIWVAGWDAADAQGSRDALTSLQRWGDELSIARASISVAMISQLCGRYREAAQALCAGYNIILESTEALAESDLSQATWRYQVGVAWAHCFLGELGRALATYEASMEICERNGDRASARALGTYRAVVLYFCRDYRGVLSACEAHVGGSIVQVEDAGAPGDAVQPLELRISLIFSALAYIELGDLQVAERHLAAAERALRLRSVYLDWYWRLPLAWAVGKLLSRSGKQADAVGHAERFVALAEQTEEHTWRALAYQARADLALSAGDPRGALEWLERAGACGGGLEIPLADFVVQGTASRAYAGLGDTRRARTHSQAREGIRRRLIDSLPRDHYARDLLEPDHDGAVSGASG